MNNNYILIEKFIKESGITKEHCPEEFVSIAQHILTNVLPLIEELELDHAHEDSSLTECEDHVYSLLMSACVESYNYIYEALCNGNPSPFKELARKCYELSRQIKPKFASDEVKESINQNKTIIESNCVWPAKTIAEHLAVNEKVCWFCGGEATHVLNVPFSKSETTNYLVVKSISTETRVIQVYACEDCRKELDARKRWKYITGAIIFIALSLIIAVCSFIFRISSSLYWVGLLSLSLFMSIILMKNISTYIRRVFKPQSIRQFEREISDHPIVSRCKDEGFE